MLEVKNFFIEVKDRWGGEVSWFIVVSYDAV